MITYAATPFRMRGFSLVELSIVLVIIGLLTGGILAGRALITASELRSVGTQYQSYNTATQAFRDKYFGMPGDFLNATRFWPADATCACYSTSSCSARVYMAASNGQTCNGDGDGQVYGPGTAFGEVYLFWQHLALAGLIPGTYTGAPAKVGGLYTGTPTYNSLNVPTSKLRSGVFILVNPPLQGGTSGRYWATRHALTLGVPNTADSGGAIIDAWPGSILLPEENYNIDMKYDDGKPSTGIVTANDKHTNGSFACIDTSTPPNYNLSNTNISCDPVFDAGF